MTDACPLCAGPTAPLFEKAGQRYSLCRRCGLRFAPDRDGNPNFRQSIGEFEPAYRQYLEGDESEAANIDAAIHWVERYVDLRSPATRVLDVGAGSGKFLRRLREVRQCSVAGIEPSSAPFREYGLAGLGVEAITLPALAASGVEPFDVITVFDVIEHIPAAVEFVKALGSLAKPGAFVFVSTPDTGGMLARMLGRHWHHYNGYHFALYNAESLAMAARLGGFEPVESRHRGKRMRLGYLWNYALDFGLPRPRAHASPGSRLSVPINVGDILSVVWTRPR